MQYVPASVSSGISSVRERLLSLGKNEFINSQLYYPSSHLLSKKSKYLRPTLVLLSAYSIGANPRSYIDLASAAELLHTSSLVHDDIIDRDEERRGTASVHVKYGVEAAILGGDALISKAIQLSSAYGKEVMDSMAKAALEMCAGEALDYSFQERKSIPAIKECLEIARLKSASLIGASCSAVPIHKKAKSAAEFYNFGINFGIAFQIKDDISDYRGEFNAYDYKPNIVRAIEKSERLNRREALESAEELLKRHVEKGLASIKSKKSKALFLKYSELLSTY